MSKIDMTGWIMSEHGVLDSKLTVLYELKERTKDRGIIWHCKCECGNEVDVKGAHLRSGNTKSCGCLQKEKASIISLTDITGQKFGFLTVLNKTNKRASNRNIIWHCKCDCGKEIDVNGDSLKSGNTQSCGCLKSKGELKISQILKNNNIFFEKEKVFFNFEDTNKPAKYDFYIVNEKYIIEYDGIQHFKPGTGWNTKEKFIKTQEHDKIKNRYCFEHNIPIIRIPYTNYDNICLEDLIPETSKFLLKQG